MASTGPEAHDLRVEAGDPAGHDAGERGDAELAGLGVAHDDHGGGPVVERAGVAGGDRAALAEHRLSSASLSRVVPGRGPSSLVTTVPSGSGHRDDLPVEEAGLLGGHRPRAGTATANSSCSSRVTPLVLGHVLRGLAHGDVDVGQAGSSGVHGSPAAGVRATVRASASAKAGLWGPTSAAPWQVAAHRLDAGGHEDVALAGPDGVGGHPDRLEGRRAVAVHRHAGHVGQAGQEGGDPGEVVARLTGRLAGAHDDVLDRAAGRAGRDLGQDLADHQGGEVVGTAVDE